MSERSIREVVGLICESRRRGDVVTLSIGHDGRLSILTAPSYVLDAVTDGGYYLSAEFGAVVVSAEGSGHEAA